MNLPILPQFSHLILIGAMAAAMVALILVVTVPSRSAIARGRLRSLNGGATGGPTMLSTATGQLTSLIERRLGGSQGALATKLDIAQIKTPAQEYVLLTGVAALVLAALLGMILGAPGIALGVVAGALGGYANVEFQLARTRTKFANQLDEALQVMAGSLRAGYSLMQALSSLAGEDGEAPGRDEFARAINQSRLGRSISECLDETAVRMKSDDFGWVSQAIAINREVGGNLASVLDGVATTIRERGRLRRQVKALAAEGKMSAYILGSLPFVIAVIVSFMSPGYLGVFFTSGILGYIFIAVGVVMLITGLVIMNKMIAIKF